MDLLITICCPVLLCIAAPCVYYGKVPREVEDGACYGGDMVTVNTDDAERPAF